MEEKKYDLGDIVELPEELTGALDVISENLQTASVGMKYHTQVFKVAQQELWEFLHEKLPGLQRFKCSYDHVEKRIYVYGYNKGFPTKDICEGIQEIKNKVE